MMKLETDTPLSDVIKYIKDATQNEAAGLPSGIPIYVDPIGLQDADKSIADSLTIKLEGLPLKTTLRLVLKHRIPDELPPYLSPLTWRHINLTGDYVWNYDQDAIGRDFRPLRLSPQYRIAA